MAAAVLDPEGDFVASRTRNPATPLRAARPGGGWDRRIVPSNASAATSPIGGRADLFTPVSQLTAGRQTPGRATPGRQSCLRARSSLLESGRPGRFNKTKRCPGVVISQGADRI